VISLYQLFGLRQKSIGQCVVAFALMKLVDQPAIGGVLSEPLF